jgi:hypothetical protein
MNTRFFGDFYRDRYGPSKLEAPALVPEQKSAGLQGDVERHTAPSLVPAVPAVPADLLIGLRLVLDRTCDRRHACCRTPSGAHIGVIEAGAGPHGHGLRCSLCGRHRGWLPARAADLLRRLFYDGRLSALSTLRDRGIVP